MDKRVCCILSLSVSILKHTYCLGNCVASLLLLVYWLVPCIVPSTLTAPTALSALFKGAVETGWSYHIPVRLSWGRVSEWFAEVRCPHLMESPVSWA